MAGGRSSALAEPAGPAAGAVTASSSVIVELRHLTLPETDTMTDDTMAFFNLVRERGGGDLLKDLAEAVLQRLMDYDVENLVGAARYERNEARTTQRNGFRERNLETRLRHARSQDPEAAPGQLFPRLPGAAQDRRTGARRRRAGGLDPGHFDAQGR